MKKILLIVLLIILLSGLAYGKCYRIEFRWNKNNKEEDLAGFKMYQGDVSGDPSFIALPSIPADANTCIVDANIPIGKSQFFAITAFDNDNNESDYSNFVEFTAKNQAPITKTCTIVTDENVPIKIILEAVDPDSDKIKYSIFAQPLHGTLSGDILIGEVIYTPNKDYSGADNFIFRATDGYSISNDAMVSIVVNNIPPAKPNKLKINRCLPIL